MSEPGSTRVTLQRVAVHIVARARIEATGRFSLRITPGGFGTPELGSDGRRVRVSGGHLVVESDAPGAARSSSTPIEGATLGGLAAFAGVDLDDPIDVGHDTPPVGDPTTPLALDHAHAAAIAEWYLAVAAMLDGVAAAIPAAGVTLPRLWPEHFDLAFDAEARPGVRVNLGGSPGDGFSDEPYLYVAPWTADRPGDPAFWNAPFGATLTRRQLGTDLADRTTAGTAFLLDGYGRLA
jgi:hypothetical protein